MDADHVLKTGYVVRTETEYRETAVQRQGDTVQFEPFGLQWRTLSPGDRVKKGIFLFSVGAAVGYYLFLGILALIR
ncbi:MAG: hypothetical protein KAR73_14210 [Spirochaetales bacterium]|nr:hypothetical protein [Spirochaetales bacterium]